MRAGGKTLILAAVLGLSQQGCYVSRFVRHPDGRVERITMVGAGVVYGAPDGTKVTFPTPPPERPAVRLSQLAGGFARGFLF